VVVQKRRDGASAKVRATQLLLCLNRQARPDQMLPVLAEAHLHVSQLGSGSLHVCIAITLFTYLNLHFFVPFVKTNTVPETILNTQLHAEQTEIRIAHSRRPPTMPQFKDIAPYPTEGHTSAQAASSGLVNSVPSRDATPATSAAQQSDNIAHALAGAGGGLLAMTLTYPLITLSTRAQVEASRSSGADASLIAAIRAIIKREGIQGLYAGLDSALFGISVTNFVYYYWYEWTRAFFEKAAIKAGRTSKKLTTVESMLAGAVAGGATVFLTNPIWVVNTRMTTRKEEAEKTDVEGQKVKKPSTIGTLMSLIKNEGLASLFAGVMPALVLVINPILQYTIFEQLKNFVEKTRRVGPRDAFLMGALGKLLATTITYPYITIKSRAHVTAKGQGKGMWTTLRQIVDQEGWSGLYGGVVPKVTQSVLTAAFLFAFKDVLYEMTVTARRNAQAKLLKK
jgi:solute carrier family 25 (peroxisomal adenine nucleotide transporter), member 17